MTKIILLTIALLQFSISSFADDRCLNEAIRIAKEQTTQTSIVSEVQNLQVSKSYLEAYQVTLVSALAPPRTEIYRIVLMKSDCTQVE